MALFPRPKEPGLRTAEDKPRSSLDDAYAARFQPQGPVEECLVKRMAHAQWHRTRLANIQMGLMSHDLEGAGEALTRCKGNLAPRPTNAQGSPEPETARTKITKRSHFRPALPSHIFLM